MADDNYNTSQSNLNGGLDQRQLNQAQQEQQQQHQQQQFAMRSDSLQQLNDELGADGRQPSAARTTRIADEMSQDLQYLSRDAPLDGGESTFGGAYSTLGGSSSQQQVAGLGDGPAGQTTTTTTHQHTFTTTMTRQSGASPGDNDYERTDFRIDADDQTGPYDYEQQQSARSSRQQQSSEPSYQLEQLAPDNVDIQRPLQQAGFLVSFMVDARGGAMRGCRHSGVRVIIPPNSAPQPMRITCRYLRRERLIHPPPLMEGEACASKIMEVGPAGAKFLGPVLIEVPHFASLRGKEREIIILRSDTGEVWREHLISADDELIESIISSAELVDNNNYDQQQENVRPGSALGAPDDVFSNNSRTNGGGGGGDSQQQQQQQQEKRLTRIVTNEFPQYFAIISRIRQEVHTVGPDGSVVDSQVVPRVQAIFTEGALTKRIKIGLQAQSVPSEQVMKLFGSLSAITFSPIVTIEPRRRKFHCPIKLKIPLPPGYRPESSANLRLLCSITGGQSKAIWEDVTSSTPLTLTDKCLLFTTTVSARFWLVHCQRAQRCQDAARFAQELWRYLIQVPFMAKFVVFAKRRDINEASVRVFSMTDDKEEKTLEVQEHYTLVARSRDVEVLDGQLLYLEFGGNLIPTHLVANARRTGSGPHQPVANSSVLINEQLAFAFYAFQENRLAFGVRLREVGQEPSGRIAFMEDSIKYLASLNQQQRAYLNERRRRAVCTLGVQLPAMCVHYDSILGTPKRNSYYATARIGDLTLADIAAELSITRLPPSASSTGLRAAAGGGAWSPDSRAELEDSLNQLEGDQYRRGVSTASLLSAESSSLGPSAANSQPARRRPDWMKLAPKLGIPRDEVEFIADHCGQAESDQGGGVAPALLLLMHWYRLSSPDDRDQDLARGLVAIGREDIAHRLNFAIEPKRISRSTMELLREIEMIPVRSTENLYGGSELSSGYTAPPASRLASGVASRGSSLRRLDQNAGPAEADSFEEERRQRARTASAGSASASRQQRQRSQEDPTGQYYSQDPAGQFESGGGGSRKDYRESHTIMERTTIVQQTSQPSGSSSGNNKSSSKRQRRRRG